MRETIDFNRGWCFHHGDSLPREASTPGAEFTAWQKAGAHALSNPGNPAPDSWRKLDVPHDFVIEGAVIHTVLTDQPNHISHGYLPRGKAWYVKKFEVPESDRNRRLQLEFDGVFRDCTIHVNGHFIGRHLSGYTSFGFDITDVCRFGELNAVSVQVDATESELWSYEGGGIYRSTRLVKTSCTHIPRWGVHIVTGGEHVPGKIAAQIDVENSGDAPVAATVACHILDDAGAVCVEMQPQTLSIDPVARTTASIHALIKTPRLWSTDTPVCYRLVTEVSVNGAVTDRYVQPFGFRFFRFDPQTGFHLNGRPLKIKGVCCHQDHAGVGVAVPRALQEWRVKQLQELGANAIRTSHNPPDPALLDACDRMGMLVMDEMRMPGSSGEMQAQLADTIRRDRNHPSVILWSLGNEEMGIQNTTTGLAIFSRLQGLAHALDPTRPVTYAMNCDWPGIIEFHDAHRFRFDVVGANYRGATNSSDCYDSFHARHPDWPLIGSETWGGCATRGLYEPDRSTIPVEISKEFRDRPECWLDDDARYFASAYGGTVTPWGCTLEETWRDCASRPFLAGTFIWTGFDYRGEQFPYEWPSVISRFGILDYCGFYKEVAHYLRAWWRRDTTHIFLMPHWNWEGREGEAIRVRCYANCAEVELFLNGTSLGRSAMPENSRLEWRVPYVPGCLEAIGFDAGGKRICSSARKTAKAPAGLRLWTDRKCMTADGADVLVVNAAVIDATGEICPLADNEVEFEVSGTGVILGLGNGDPMSHESEKFTNRRRAYHGLCQVLIQSCGTQGTLSINATSRQLESGSLSVTAAAP